MGKKDKKKGVEARTCDEQGCPIDDVRVKYNALKSDFERQLSEQKAELAASKAAIDEISKLAFDRFDRGQFICATGWPDDPVDLAKMLVTELADDMDYANKMLKYRRQDVDELKEQLGRAKDEYSIYFCLSCSEDLRGERNCAKEGRCDHIEKCWKEDVLDKETGEKPTKEGDGKR